MDVLELGDDRLLDINAAVSEACNNVVVHAYEGTEGPMDVYLCIQPTELEVIVSDDGVGIRPNVPEPDLDIQGLGLSLIHALTDRVEFLGGMGEGTKVRMSFAFDGDPDVVFDRDRADEREARPPPGELSIAVSPGPLAAPVLGRVIAMLAARAEFSLEGISEAQLVTDTIAANAPRADRRQQDPARHRSSPGTARGSCRSPRRTAEPRGSSRPPRWATCRRCSSGSPSSAGLRAAEDGELLCLVLGAR